MFHAISPIQEKRNKKSKTACCEQVFGWFLTADECPRYGGWCVSCLGSWGLRKGTPTPTPIPSNINQFVLVSKPQPQATNINQHQAICFVLWICFILTVGGQMGEVWEVCSKGSPHRSINPASGICFWDASIHQPWKAYRWCPQGRAMEMSEKWIS